MKSLPRLQALLDSNARHSRPRSLKQLFGRSLRSRRRTDADWLVLLAQMLELDARSDASKASSAASTKGRMALSRCCATSQLRKPDRDNSSPTARASATYRPKNDSLSTPDCAAWRKLSA